MTTWEFDEADRDTVLAGDADGYVTKPVDVDQLLIEGAHAAERRKAMSTPVTAARRGFNRWGQAVHERVEGRPAPPESLDLTAVRDALLREVALLREALVAVAADRDHNADELDSALAQLRDAHAELDALRSATAAALPSDPPTEGVTPVA
jgi:hypothetical protein